MPAKTKTGELYDNMAPRLGDLVYRPRLKQKKCGKIIQIPPGRSVALRVAWYAESGKTFQTMEYPENLHCYKTKVIDLNKQLQQALMMAKETGKL